MVEVFKTDVTDFTNAEKLLKIIHLNFEHYVANFDLDDSDKILRIFSEQENICAQTMVVFLARNGCCAEVLVG